jgi:hypothetical protein
LPTSRPIGSVGAVNALRAGPSPVTRRERRVRLGRRRGACTREDLPDRAIAMQGDIDQRDRRLCVQQARRAELKEGIVMTVMWMILGSLLFIVWVLSIVDIFRRHYSGGTTVGYLALVVILPFVGSVIYWAVRKPTPAETEAAYLGQAEMRRSVASRPFDSTGL